MQGTLCNIAAKSASYSMQPYGNAWDMPLFEADKGQVDDEKKRFVWEKVRVFIGGSLQKPMAG